MPTDPEECRKQALECARRAQTAITPQAIIANKDDPRIPMTAAEFLAKAWKLANDRAREIGWIV